MAYPQSALTHYEGERPTLIERAVQRVEAGLEPARERLVEAVAHETARLAPGAERARWEELARRLPRLDDETCAAEASALARVYAEEIAGHFDRRVFHVATRFVAPLLSGILAPARLPLRLPRVLGSGVAPEVVVDGAVETLRAARGEGPFILLPTHSSNLDALVVAHALHRAELPPVICGIGSNLFATPAAPVLARLGGYRVDRRLRHRLYTDVLKAWATVLVGAGFDTMFFPGGTRSRSGRVEEHLKLGLLGACHDAWCRAREAGAASPLFVPVTLNHRLVLEAEALARPARDLPRPSGRDGWRRLGRLGRVGRVVVRFGAPLEPGAQLGSLVEALLRFFRRETVVLDTHVVAAAGLKLLRGEQGNAVRVSLGAMQGACADLRARLLALEADGQTVLAADVRASPIDRLLAAGARALRSHHPPTVVLDGRGATLANPWLLSFYANRLAHLDG